ncbi:hypothetical protein F4778DRAFT_779599 [Xylariomycetidae sp. FL2044]|nr:hypothetical protein F4778DRAFT_779599 [Xylariomycetidae sp. FL2044]
MARVVRVRHLPHPHRIHPPADLVNDSNEIHARADRTHPSDRQIDGLRHSCRVVRSVLPSGRQQTEALTAPTAIDRRASQPFLGPEPHIDAGECVGRRTRRTAASYANIFSGAHETHNAWDLGIRKTASGPGAVRRAGALVRVLVVLGLDGADADGEGTARRGHAAGGAAPELERPPSPTCCCCGRSSGRRRPEETAGDRDSDGDSADEVCHAVDPERAPRQRVCEGGVYSELPEHA